jgi:hypothetical protein
MNNLELNKRLSNAKRRIYYLSNLNKSLKAKLKEQLTNKSVLTPPESRASSSLSSYSKITPRSSKKAKMSFYSDIFVSVLSCLSGRQRRTLKSLLISQGRDIFASTNSIETMKKSLVAHADYILENGVIFCQNIENVVEHRVSKLLLEGRLIV